MITLDPDKLREYQVSPDEATAAVYKASLVMPSGNVRIGDRNLFATSNATLGGNLDALLELRSEPLLVHGVFTRYWHDSGCDRHPDRIRSCKWPPDRLHPSHEANDGFDTFCH